MDINRSRSRPKSQPQAIDGFFVRQPGAPLRRVNDFNRMDGFHTAPRRTLKVVAAPQHKSNPVRPTQQIQAAPAVREKPRRRPGQFETEIPTDKRAKRGLLRRKNRSNKHAKVGKVRTIRKWAFRFSAMAVILVLVVGGLLFGKGYFKLKKVFSGGSSAAALQANVDPTLLKGEGDGRVNILMMGIGGAAHSGGDLTDTIMIASIDPINNQATLVSVPRDLWVKMPNNFVGNYQKINAAYEAGKYKYLGKQDSSNANKKAVQAGFLAADSTIEGVIGIPIHYNVLVDFKAFSQAVDTVGGISINAKEQLYDPSMAWENEWSPVLAKVGINNFDGRHALNYVRSRHTSSDFARSERQRAVLIALKDKVANAGTLTNPVKLSNLLSAFGDNVQTDISLNDMTRLASIAKKIPNSSVQSVGLTDPPNNYVTTGDINGISVVQPLAGLEDYTAIQTFIRSKLKDGYISQENAKVTVLNGTVTPGLATEKADELKSYGYNVGTVDNAPTSDYSETIIYDSTNGNKKYTLNYLKKRYSVQTVTKTLPAGIVQNGADIVIILGQDITTTQ